MLCNQLNTTKKDLSKTQHLCCVEIKHFRNIWQHIVKQLLYIFEAFFKTMFCLDVKKNNEEVRTNLRLQKNYIVS